MSLTAEMGAISKLDRRDVLKEVSSDGTWVTVNKKIIPIPVYTSKAELRICI
jgi:hypothetical protein